METQPPNRALADARERWLTCLPRDKGLYLDVIDRLLDELRYNNAVQQEICLEPEFSD